MATSIDPEGHTNKRVGMRHKNILAIKFLIKLIQSDNYASTILHDLDDTEKLKNRLNRRLQKLARWGDKPVDDRQPAEMRLQLRSNVVTQFKSSYGGMINMPTTGSQSVYNQVAAISTRIQSYSAAPLPIQNVAPTVSAVAPVAPSSSSSLPSSSSSSSSQPSERDSQQKVTNMFNPEGVSAPSSISAIQLPTQRAALPPFASIQNQQENPSVTSLNLTPPSNLMGGGTTSTVSMMGTLGSSGLSMGGISTGLESMKALQMQSVKEVSEALRSSDKEA